MRGMSRYAFDARGSVGLRATIGGAVKGTPLDRWIAERYSLFTAGKRGLYRGDVLHDPWRLQAVDQLELQDSFSEQFGFSSRTEVHARYALPLDVRFRPFVKLN